MDEIQFIESIDASFPYDDEEKWMKLIIKGGQISENASFMVLHEICRAPNLIFWGMRDLSQDILNFPQT